MRKVAGILAVVLAAGPAVAGVDYFPVTVDGSFNLYRYGGPEGYENHGPSSTFRVAKGDQHVGYMDWAGSMGDSSGQSLDGFIGSKQVVGAYLYIKLDPNAGPIGGTTSIVSFRTGNQGDIVQDQFAEGHTEDWSSYEGTPSWPAAGFQGSTQPIAWRGGVVPTGGFPSIGDGVGTPYIAPSGRQAGLGYSPYNFGAGDAVQYELGAPAQTGLFRGFNAGQGMWALEDVLGMANSQGSTTLERFGQAGQLVNLDATGNPILVGSANVVGTEDPRNKAGDAADDGWVKVALSADMVMDLAFNTENKGLAFLNRTAFTEVTYNNWSAFSSEHQGGILGAYLALEVVPEPMTLSLLALGGLALLRRRQA